MSTRSLINVECNDGIVRSVYCHFDGSDHLPTLQLHYNSQELAEALVNLGDMSSLGPFMSCPEGHSFENPVDDYSVFYHRDRGEDWDDTCPAEFDTLAEARKQDRGQQYIYEWKEGAWRGYNVYRKRYM